MISGKIVVLFLLLPIVRVETGLFDFFTGVFESDNLRPFNPTEFKKDLDKSLYGQHIALKTIWKAVSGFMKDPNPSKPLVLSLHGPPGVGKSLVARIIARNIYEMGVKSKHFQTFLASYHFPHMDQPKEYEGQLKQWIHGNVSSFPHSMFIFDEMDCMNPYLIGTLKPFLDSNINLDGVSFHNAIFIFLSNAGQFVINRITLDFWSEGKGREELQTKEFETQIYEDVFNDTNSAFWHSRLIEHHLVDHFIPFLPLEQKHVRQCVLAEMTSLNITVDYNLADKLTTDMSYFPPEEKIFSIKGCKQVKQKLFQYIDY